MWGLRVGRRGVRRGIGTAISHYVHTVQFLMAGDVFRRVRKIANS
jgi:hypothetical protein